MQTRSKGADNLLSFTYQELARLERAHKALRSKSVTMGDNNDNQDLAAQLREIEEKVRLLEQHQPVEQPAIGSSDTPHTFYQNRSAIVPPTLERQDYEIRPAMIALVKQLQYNGLPAENPMQHIEDFETICSTTRSNGVPADYNKCILFQFSLADKAARWLKSLPAGSLNGWEAARAAFLDYFYTKSRTASLKHKITSFQQLHGETFCEAWERFKEYQRNCPHHGYTAGQLLGIFYDGADDTYKNTMNAASNGDFMTQTQAGAYKLIDNLAASSYNRSSEYDRTMRIRSADSCAIDEINEKLNRLIKSQKRVKISDPEIDGIFSTGLDDEQEVNMVHGQGIAQRQGFNPSYRNHPNPSAQPFQIQGLQQKQPYGNYPTAPQPAPIQSDPNDELKAMLQQVLVSQQQSATALNTKVDGIYKDLDSKFEALSSHVKKLDTQVAQTAEAIKRPQGVLPGRAEQNPRAEHANAVNSATGTEAEGDNTEELKAMMQQLLVGQQQSTAALTAKIDGVYTDLNGKFEALSSHVKKIDIQVAQTLEAHGFEGGERTKEHSSVSAPSQASISQPIPERVYVPKVPYPKPPKKSAEEISVRYDEMFAGLKTEFPSEEVQQLPALRRCILRWCASNCSIEEGVKIVAQEVNAVLLKKHPGIRKESKLPQPKLLPKVVNPGKFAIPCSIAGVQLEDSLCDSGATVNIMSKELAEQLGITKISPPEITIAYADSKTSTPYGTILDLHVTVGNCVVCVDFQVVEMRKGCNKPLLLGLPFMASVGAVMDFANQRMSFTLIDEKVFYAPVSTKGATKLASGISAATVHKLTSEPDKGVGDRSKTNEVLDGKPRTVTKTPKAKPQMTKKVENKRTSQPFTRMTIIIPSDLRGKGEATIKEMLQGTMALFPHVRSWQVKDGGLVAVGMQQRAGHEKLSPDTGDPANHTHPPNV